MSREMLSDERLMVQVGQGSPEALEELFERYRDPLWRFLARRVDATARAEELHQDVFLALLQGAQRYEPRSSFRSYLFGIAYNVLLADRRKDRQRAAEPLVEDPQAVTPDPDAALWVRRALETLDSEQREIVMLREYESRLVNARNTEKRLNDVLLNRTGKVGDVLEVEREISRVRAEIERLDAERVNLDRRVSYATVTLQISEQRKATLDIGPQPLSVRLQNAFIDGLSDALEMTTSALLRVLRVAPTLLVWTILLWWPVRTLRRAFLPKTS